MSFLQKINDGFTDFLNQGDPRVKSWPMMQTPFPGCVLIVAYIYFVKVAGPKWMKNRKAFDLRNTMLVYNFAMVFANLYIFLEIGRYGWFNNYSLKCQPVDYSNNYEAVRMAEVGWLYYIIKFVEFADTMVGKAADLGEFDKGQIVTARRLGQSISQTARLVMCSRSTVVSTFKKWSEEERKPTAGKVWADRASSMLEIFFVLRKKNSHISPLHVIHHSIVPFSLWFGIKFAPGGYNALFPFLNSFVHVLMYSYYGLAALGPQLQKYLIWKKYITFIQMAQFLCIALYTAHLLCFGNCEISKAFIFANAFHAVLFFILFWDFFRKAYRSRAGKRSLTKTNLANSCFPEPPKRKEFETSNENKPSAAVSVEGTKQQVEADRIRWQECEKAKSKGKNGPSEEFQIISSEFVSSYAHRINGNIVKKDLTPDSTEFECAVRNRNGFVSVKLVKI